ncbi:8-amino-7-oxononanoate synthase [Actibacterium pelagium]|uniref:8-amino-7-oxononanoate synthase n=1 Tax=Actibacterium pelagium TaxID=2029103 RepID=A0A917AIU1_9RHOB|nr:8-amino-7-oxononanoate synthase [Actibacterium pelagium]GGE54970.1 8-amino-7-oxononanoate synthase [Actibacterium pelagium]
MSGFARHASALEALKTRGRLRVLSGRGGYDFASNDYLGLADSDLLRNAAMAAIQRGVPVGSGGSRLLRGNAEEHELLEAEAAAFFSSEAALFMGGGFVANTAIFSTLPMQGDLVLFDEWVHASAHEGMKLGRADTQAFAHNDVSDAAAKLEAWQGGRVWIAVESVYSMDGDIAPLKALAELAVKHDAVLVVDEAHATGAFGAGLAHGLPGDIVGLHTCGKGLGVHGALITADRVLIDTLIAKARSFIYATAPSPLNAALVRAALAELSQSDTLPKAHQALVAHAHAEAERCLGLTGFDSQIMPVIVGEDRPALDLAARMQAHGYDIRAIRPPTVPKGTSRLRIPITLNTPAEVITEMFETLAKEMAK